jgi:hypothetical protein
VSRLYLDSDVSLRVVPALRAQNHEVLTSRDAGLAHAGDYMQLLTAMRTGRVLITHNRSDFVLLHHAWLVWPRELGVSFPPHPSILVLDQAPVSDYTTALLKILEDIATLQANSLYWWRSAHGWSRRSLIDMWEPI